MVKEDKNMAKNFHIKVCDSGNLDSCTTPGSMYELGEIVKLDSYMARQLHGKSCRGGYLPGCIHLLNLKAI